MSGENNVGEVDTLHVRVGIASMFGEIGDSIDSVEDGVEVDVEDVHLSHSQQRRGDLVLQVNKVEVDTQLTQLHTLVSTVGSSCSA